MAVLGSQLVYFWYTLVSISFWYFGFKIALCYFVIDLFFFVIILFENCSRSWKIRSELKKDLSYLKKLMLGEKIYLPVLWSQFHSVGVIVCGKLKFYWIMGAYLPPIRRSAPSTKHLYVIAFMFHGWNLFLVLIEESRWLHVA